MREYSRFAPTFWTGTTGKAIKAHGPETTLVAVYLFTNPHANMLGIYYLPVLYVAHETGIPLEGASKALQRLSEGGFCSYDTASEVVWVYEMARWQVGESLNAKDNQVKSINKLYQNIPKCPFLGEFFEKYHAAYHLENQRHSEAPSKPLRSQEQEQEQEQDSSPIGDELCAEPKGSPPAAAIDDPVVVEIPTNRHATIGEVYQVTASQVSGFQVTYPAVDVVQTLRRIQSWCSHNQPKRKTLKGMPKFIDSWLAREQDRGPNHGSRSTPGAHTKLTPAQQTRQKLAERRAARGSDAAAVGGDGRDVSPSVELSDGDGAERVVDRAMPGTH
ncbi:MAG: replication protein [Pseudomonadota bacterium]